MGDVVSFNVVLVVSASMEIECGCSEWGYLL